MGTLGYSGVLLDAAKVGVRRRPFLCPLSTSCLPYIKWPDATLSRCSQTDSHGSLLPYPPCRSCILLQVGRAASGQFYLVMTFGAPTCHSGWTLVANETDMVPTLKGPYKLVGRHAVEQKSKHSSASHKHTDGWWESWGSYCTHRTRIGVLELRVQLEIQDHVPELTMCL
jgi:hypothetical protein